MKPSQAMGLFLTTWRAEWARLSRAQLALLVCSQLHQPAAVTPAIVRKWEAGQPPKDLEELEALCQVMGRHGLTAPETGQFRDAVLAACLDRHYEGLFPEEDFAQSPDCDAVAAGLFATNWLDCQFACPVSVMAAIAELELALAGDGTRRTSRAQTERQRIALVYLLHGMDRHHGRHGRYASERDMVSPLPAFVTRHFGPRGFDERLSPSALQVVASFSAASAERLAGGPGLAARRLLGVSRQALSQGDAFAGLEALAAALLHPTAFGHDEYGALIVQTEHVLSEVAGVHSDTWWTPHSSLTLAALRAGDLARAVRHFESLQARADQSSAARRHVGECGALLAWHTGDRAQAEAYLHALQAQVKEDGDPGYAEGVTLRLTACSAGEPPPTPLTDV